jgi:hypothetical protein
MNTKTYTYSIIGAFVVIILFIGIGIYSSKKNAGPDLTQFATCLKDKGVQFYGAFWCPHCREQKNLFGKYESLLPYTECSTPDGQDMTENCKAKGVKGYPTWIYPDGTTEQGFQSLQHLSEKTSCPLPAEVQNTII